MKRSAKTLFARYLPHTLRAGENKPGISLIQAVGGRPFKPLAKIADYPKQPQDLTFRSITEWRKSSAFDKTTAVFKGYPDNSLVGGIARELLYHIIRSTKAQNVIEVGTYYAATSEVMARALWENGCEGLLHTTDPFGRERCPSIISGWPSELQKHIRFYPLNSMDFFGELERGQVVVDMAFIDGNHDYEYAFFDLASAAKLIRPSGIVLMDNVEQPGPFWAAVEFLRQNPDWTELGNSVASFVASDPFNADRGFIPGTPFILLKAPAGYIVKSAPRATGQQIYGSKQLTGLRLTMAEPAPKGVLHMQLFLRGFSNEYDPEQLIAVASAPLDGETSYQLKLPQTLETNHSTRHTVETILFWEPHDHADTLQLTKAPQPLGL